MDTGNGYIVSLGIKPVPSLNDILKSLMYRSNRPRHSPHYNQMLHIVEEMQNYTHAWPFLEPVSIEDVADYYDIIKDPMGKLHTATLFIYCSHSI